jgi:hypothetical protein
MADFRPQHGIHILYGDYGQYYVGLTRTQGLGKRLRNHLTDEHGKNWDRFSWFSFGRVLKNRNAHGLQRFARLPPKQSLTSNSVIGDIEALLIQIQAMSLQNSVKMKSAQAERWTQVKLSEVETYRKRLR